MALHATCIQNAVDQLPTNIRQLGRDYLAQERLARRWRLGDADYAAELRGYADRYHPHIHAHEAQLVATCTCEGKRMPCRHAAALLLDLEQNAEMYYEAPWALAQTAPPMLARWPFDQELNWDLIPDLPPFWREPFSDGALHRLQQRLQTSSIRSRLSRDPLAPLWAEMHASWLEQPAVRAQFDLWRGRHLTKSLPDDFEAWLMLHWMQPCLPLAPIMNVVSAGADNSACVDALLSFLWRPHLVHPTGERLVTMLADLTILQPDLANVLWTRYTDLDPGSLRQADAWYQAGRADRAIALIDRHLPDDPKLRREARLRLIAWLAPEDAIPHRIALAWESCSLTPVEPVRHLIDAKAWDSLKSSIQARQKSGAVTDDRA